MDPIEEQRIADDQLHELTLGFSETAVTLFSGRSVVDTLGLVVELSVTSIEGCDCADLRLHDGPVGMARLQSDPIAEVMAALHLRTGEGPSLDAIAQKRICYAEDFASNSEWPNFGPLAIDAGIRCILALPLTTDGHPAALTLYAQHPGAFSPIDRAKGVILASLASIALSAAHSHEDEDLRSANLNVALGTRELTSLFHVTTRGRIFR